MKSLKQILEAEIYNFPSDKVSKAKDIGKDATISQLKPKEIKQFEQSFRQASQKFNEYDVHDRLRIQQNQDGSWLIVDGALYNPTVENNLIFKFTKDKKWEVGKGKNEFNYKKLKDISPDKLEKWIEAFAKGIL